MKRSLLLFSAALLLHHATAQPQSSADSSTFANIQWETRKIARGVYWKYAWFENSLFASNQSISILEVRKKKTRKKFDLGYEKQILKRTSDFGRDANALAALNGTFFDIKNGGSVDFIKSDGVVINENRPEKDGSRARHQKAALVFNRGKLTIAKWDETADWEHRLEGDDIMLSGPLLVYHSGLESVDTTAFSRSRHPRTAVAVTKDNVLLIAVDGRHQRASGMSLPELRKILKWLGAVDGINLDGGGSTTLWIDGQSENGVVNYPSDNKQWDHLGERKVANVVLLK